MKKMLVLIGLIWFMSGCMEYHITRMQVDALLKGDTIRVVLPKEKEPKRLMGALFLKRDTLHLQVQTWMDSVKLRRLRDLNSLLR